MARGLFVLLDYGMEETELWSAHPSGTLAAVRRHHSVNDPFGAPGSTDLSVFVNFTRIREACTAAGLVQLEFGRQAEALGRWGFPALLETELRAARSPEEEVRTRLATKNLLFGFDRFQVLELAAPESADVLSRLRRRTQRSGDDRFRDLRIHKDLRGVGRKGKDVVVPDVDRLRPDLDRPTVLDDPYVSEGSADSPRRGRRPRGTGGLLRGRLVAAGRRQRYRRDRG